MIQIKRSELKQLAQNKFGGDSIELQNKILIMISTSLAARTSYTIVGEEKEINYENMIALHDRLLVQQPPHSSPMEHCARAMDDDEHKLFLKGLAEVTHSEPEYEDLVDTSNIQGWCYNLKGFIPYRYMVDNNLSL